MVIITSVAMDTCNKCNVKYVFDSHDLLYTHHSGDILCDHPWQVGDGFVQNITLTSCSERFETYDRVPFNSDYLYRKLHLVD